MKKESYIFETPFFIICTILIFSFCISSFNAKSFELNKNIKDSYSYIISLEFQKARDILDEEFTEFLPKKRSD